MKINKVIKTDVLVMGAGISGIMAAIKAGQEHVNVTLTSSTKIFSGSSFYPGTWGFGLIGPESKSDEQDLKDTIKAVGMGMADDELVDTFVSNITDSIEELRKWGVPLKEAQNKGEKEFIPCFDHKNRNWNGIVQAGAKEVLSQKLEESNVNLLADTEIFQCITDNDKVIGVLGLNDKDGIILIECKSFIIASGGLGGLYKYRLNTSDIRAMGQYLALNAGAKLINLEFSQMMAGFISPCYKTIHNEKVYKYCEFLDTKTRKSIFEDCNEKDINDLLSLRSTHGPFTSRMESKEIDFKIYDNFIKNEDGVTLRYKSSLKSNQPEFVKTYFDWLKDNKNLTIDDEVQLGIFYHASNGGIKINSSCETGIEGLFACGEATGGMHGADRIGGLSTANGLVFGSIAGKSAAKYAQNTASISDVKTEYPISIILDAEELIKRIQQLNFEVAMVFRSEAKICNALSEIEKIGAIINNNMVEIKNYDSSIKKSIKDSYELLACQTVTKCLLKAILQRRESRGPHFRTDYPFVDEKYNTPTVLKKGINDELCFE